MYAELFLRPKHVQQSTVSTNVPRFCSINLYFRREYSKSRTEYDGHVVLTAPYSVVLLSHRQRLRFSPRAETSPAEPKHTDRFAK